MPRKCCVENCENSEWRNTLNYENKVSFHLFPNRNDFKSIWRTQIKIGNNQDSVSDDGVVCGSHFKATDYIKINRKVMLKTTAVPTIFPNSGCVDYEILWTPFENENKENYDPQVNMSQKKRKLSDSNVCENSDMKKMIVDTVNDSKDIEVKNDKNTVKDIDTAMDIDVDTVLNAKFANEATQTENWQPSVFHSHEQKNISFPGIEVIGNPSTSKKHMRKVRYPGDIDSSIDMTPNTARRNVLLCQTKVKTQAKEIYKLKQKTKRQSLQIKSLKALLRELKKKFSLSSHATDSIESTFEDDIVRQLTEGRKTRNYNENVKSFALTLNFYSNAAYRYIRRVFGNHLPAESTLYNWYKVVNGDPGVSAEGLTILKAMSDDMKLDNKQLLVTLMHDEMAIRRQVIWNEYKKKFIGYVDHGHGGESNDSSEEATDALVYMIVPINAHGKLPIAYYFTNSFTGEEKADITKMLLTLIHDTGAEVVAYVFDGAQSNISLAKALGVDLDDVATSFKHPVTSKNIYIFLDICHMLKLVRNTFEAKGILYDGQGNAIKWDYIVQLEKLQREEGLSLGTKITQLHIHFHNNKMKVKLAAQIFSTRVADALIYCKDRPEFKGCQATIQFIQLFNDLFDVLNSKSFNDKGYKHPLHKENYQSVIDLFAMASKYIQELKVDVPRKEKNKIVVERKNVICTGNLVPLKLDSNIVTFQKVKISDLCERPLLNLIEVKFENIFLGNKRGFVGFLNGMNSYKEIYKSQVENGPLHYLLGFKFSQDHLETLFSVIRSKGGFNNNPNCCQFKMCFKRLLLRNQLTSSINANCKNDTENILHFSDLIKKAHQSSSDRNSVFKERYDDILDDIFDELNTFKLSEYAADVVVYVSGFVERQLLKKIKCETCLNVIKAGKTVDDNRLIQIKNRGGLITPRTDIVKICKISEQILWSTDISKPDFYNGLLCRIMRKFVDENLFASMSHTNHIIDCEHKLIIIKTVVSIYVNIRLRHVSKHHNINTKKQFVRAKFTKLIHFSHQ